MERRAFILALTTFTIAAASAQAKTDALAQAFANLSMANRKNAQKYLAESGFYQGSIDGAFGKGTSGALWNAAAAVKDSSYGKVVYDLSKSADATNFLTELAKGNLAKWFYGEGDESENG